jgi:hypothetical protein
VKRGLLLALVAALGCWALPAAAAAEPCPPFDGGMSFQSIQGPEDPEDYCWEVTLDEGQELQQVSDQEIDVVSKTGAAAWVINAAPAHDANGATVPTTIALTGDAEFTLTVHHRAGNPATGGAPFQYPISEGKGWEGGFVTVIMQMPPAELPAAPPAATIPSCTVPSLVSKSLRASRRALRRAGCRLGPVRGQGGRGAKVVRQYRPPGKTLPAGTAVGVRLGR